MGGRDGGWEPCRAGTGRLPRLPRLPLCHSDRAGLCFAGEMLCSLSGKHTADLAAKWDGDLSGHDEAASRGPPVSDSAK